MDFIGYFRVSTQRQGQSGLGLEAQDTTVQAYVKRVGGNLLNCFTEIESGRKPSRPELAKALLQARMCKATLIVAKLDRLSRDVKFLLNLIDNQVPVIFCDLPELGTGDPITGRLILTIFAAIAEFEARRISQRIREALAAYKRRGGKLGSSNPKCTGGTREVLLRASAQARIANRRLALEFRESIRPVARGLRSEGRTLQQTADELNRRGYKTRKGKLWTVAWLSAVLIPFDWE